VDSSPEPHPAWYEESPTNVADAVAQSHFGIAPDDASRRHGIRGFLVGAATAAVLMPALFFVRFGELNGFAWGCTTFLVVLQLLGALALFLRPRTAYHTKVRAKGDWADKIGAWWLMACAAGAFLGWILTAAVPLTPGGWRWVYGAKVLLTIVIPVATAAPLTRYARGKATLVAVPLLLFVTMLPVLTGVNSARDLWTGPVYRAGAAHGGSPTYLRYTGRVLHR
jgi:hypothetical protein